MMSNVEAPNINSSGTNNSDLLAEQSETPNMSNTKTFTVDTNMKVNGDLDVAGTVTAEAFIGDGSQLTGISAVGPQSEIIDGNAFVKIEEGDPDGDSDAPANIKMVSIGGDSLWDAEVEVLNDVSITTGDDIELNAGDDVDISAEENVKITSVDYMDLISEDNIYLTAEGKIDLEADDYIELNSEVRMIGEVVMVENLPTTDPVNAGQLWNDNGTLKVSVG